MSGDVMKTASDLAQLSDEALRAKFREVSETFAEKLGDAMETGGATLALSFELGKRGMDRIDRMPSPGEPLEAVQEFYRHLADGIPFALIKGKDRVPVVAPTADALASQLWGCVKGEVRLYIEVPILESDSDIVTFAERIEGIRKAILESS